MRNVVSASSAVAAVLVLQPLAHGQFGEGAVGVVDPSTGVVEAVVFAHEDHNTADEYEEWIFTDDQSFEPWVDFDWYVPIEIVDVPGFGPNDHSSSHDLDALAEHAAKCLGHDIGTGTAYTCSNRPGSIDYDTDCTGTDPEPDYGYLLTYDLRGPKPNKGSWSLGTGGDIVGRDFDIVEDDGGTMEIRGVMTMRYDTGNGDYEFFVVREQGGPAWRCLPTWARTASRNTIPNTARCGTTRVARSVPMSAITARSAQAGSATTTVATERCRRVRSRPGGPAEAAAGVVTPAIAHRCGLRCAVACRGRRSGVFRRKGWAAHRSPRESEAGAGGGRGGEASSRDSGPAPSK